MYGVHGSTRYTSEALILAVEDRLLAANATRTGSATPDTVLSAARARLESSHGWTFDAAQVELTAVEAGGALRLLAHAGPTVELDRVHRFADPNEAEPASTARHALDAPTP